MLTSRGTRTSKPTPSSVIIGSQSPLSAPLPLWASSYVHPCAQDKQLIVSENGELWIRTQDEASQQGKIAKFLLDGPEK